ncbi:MULTISPECIES: beta-ketoacyl-ACP synthase III [Chromobacterium]|uniref:Beta-ketoacyl-[acyl-carrier-protein] synthase III n=2 Tax=Chromobacterium TaxID=535 RepID=A0A1W0CGA3_9NEIS|nr:MULTISPECIES: beta-ketoacyl-ACP synthase III [Chromobacterium]AXT45599.1 ketoacyl-ACP synthase III [Chromobacterium rhizoryzae]MBK0414413.1 ketoacyl-ACP synthase III [Chromobacterium haemolyticum]MBO0415953.1 ketoacyl-ACP synthase III [Chromobacterium haemolyticum]MBO0499213.1 ketoacyl-ACP synthase III [Chromobacterium haemolyticum]MDH0343185.1 ketoacyl-ACP synthase III [Chromobacterium haemolyticum]
MGYSRILGTGSFLPEQVLTNAQLAERVDTSDEWIVSRTGIHARHIAAEEHKTSDLALKAAEAAIQSAGIDKHEIDLIIVATTTPDMVFPSTACLLQEKLGIPGCAAFDVQAVCAGFMFALVTANNYIKSGMARRALVVGAEIMSRVLDWDDRRTCVLFGDGAGAVILGDSDEPGILHAKLAADGRYKDILNTPAQISGGKIQGMPYLHMDGPAVFKFAVKALSDIAVKTLAEAGVDKSEVDWLVPHQANLRIIESTAKHLGLPMDRVIVTLPQQGNTSAASIPLALDSAVRDGRIRRGQTVLLEGIGGGFAWGAVLLKI